MPDKRDQKDQKKPTAATNVKNDKTKSSDKANKTKVTKEKKKDVTADATIEETTAAASSAKAAASRPSTKRDPKLGAITTYCEHEAAKNADVPGPFYCGLCGLCTKDQPHYSTPHTSSRFSFK